MQKNLKNMLIAASVALSPMIAGDVYGSETLDSKETVQVRVEKMLAEINSITNKITTDCLEGKGLASTQNTKKTLKSIDLISKGILEDAGFAPPTWTFFHLDAGLMLANMHKNRAVDKAKAEARANGEDESKAAAKAAAEIEAKLAAENKHVRKLRNTVTQVLHLIEDHPENILEFDLFKEILDEQGWSGTQWSEICEKLNNEYRCAVGSFFWGLTKFHKTLLKELDGKTIIQQMQVLNGQNTLDGLNPSIIALKTSKDEPQKPLLMFNAIFMAYLYHYTNYSYLYPWVWSIFDPRKVLDNLRPGWRKLPTKCDETTPTSSSSSSSSSGDTQADKK